MVLVALDTNVIVAGFHSRRGASFRLFTLLRAGKFEIAVSVPLVLVVSARRRRLERDTRSPLVHHARNGSRDLLRRRLPRLPVLMDSADRGRGGVIEASPPTCPAGLVAAVGEIRRHRVEPRARWLADQVDDDEGADQLASLVPCANP